MQAVALQCVHLRGDVVSAAAAAVHVFHAQQPAPAVRAGIQETAEGSNE